MTLLKCHELILRHSIELFPKETKNALIIGLQTRLLFKLASLDAASLRDSAQVGAIRAQQKLRKICDPVWKKKLEDYIQWKHKYVTCAVKLQMKTGHYKNIVTICMVNRLFNHEQMHITNRVKIMRLNCTHKMLRWHLPRFHSLKV